MVKVMELPPADRTELESDDAEVESELGRGRGGHSPWRPVIEEIGSVVDGRRDAVATIGSINWLRHAMDLAGANSNVVRNIIYRDKGRLHDKRALYLILVALREQLGLSPIEDPALTLLASPFAAAELEVSQVLGREQRRVYRSFVGGVRAGTFPKILVTGKPGAGKTMLLDFVQQGLEIEPRAADSVARTDFTEADLTAGLVRLAGQLGVPAGMVESRLVRIGAGSSFAVQADSQAEVARVMLDTQRHRQGNLAVLVHMSRALSAEGTLGALPLRLNTPEVPRVSAADWLWFTLLRPLALTTNCSVFVSTAGLPAKAVEATLPFQGPVTLAQPTTGEARRYVRSLATQLDAATSDDIVRRAGRSYEELRTFTLLALAKRPPSAEGEEEERTLGARALEELAALVDTTAEPTLRAFLAALAVLSAGDQPAFTTEQLISLKGGRRKTLTDLEHSFIDQLPGGDQRYRPFSRRLARALHERLTTTQPHHARTLHLTAAMQQAEAATRDPGSEHAGAYLFHLFAARNWTGLLAWMATSAVPFPLLIRLWATARTELGSQQATPGDRQLLEQLALELARHLLRLGADQHVELVRAFELLAASRSTEKQAWAAVLRAQLEVAAGRFERASVLLDVSPPADEQLLVAEQRLARAGVLRWRGELQAASDKVAKVRQEHGAAAGSSTTFAARAVTAKTAVWSGLIAKDRGDLGAAMTALSVDVDSDDLLRARLAFQRGDVLLRLGLFDGAKLELDNAITAAGSSGALAPERARYLARRGTLRRLMGYIVGSRDDFNAAQAALTSSELADLDLDFALAKVADEGSYTLLAE
ncbi:MAG TPA: hypothetical protein VKZ43_02370, partial [Trueperaceae bacterium]|nr:hypothetical protein [Trueperaceae bacterium]